MFLVGRYVAEQGTGMQARCKTRLLNVCDNQLTLSASKALSRAYWLKLTPAALPPRVREQSGVHAQHRRAQIAARQYGQYLEPSGATGATGASLQQL